MKSNNSMVQRWAELCRKQQQQQQRQHNKLGITGKLRTGRLANLQVALPAVRGHQGGERFHVPRAVVIQHQAADLLHQRQRPQADAVRQPRVPHLWHGGAVRVAS